MKSLNNYEYSSLHQHLLSSKLDLQCFLENNKDIFLKIYNDLHYLIPTEWQNGEFGSAEEWLAQKVLPTILLD